MLPASTVAVVVFSAIVLALILLSALAVRRVYGVSDGRAAALYGVVIAAMVLIPGALARADLLGRYSPLPAPALLLIAACTILTVALAFSPVGARLIEDVPLAWIVGYQTFRIPVEWVLHRLYLEGIVPVQMTYTGRNFDVVTGLAAAVLAIVLVSGRRPRGLVLLWNVAGLGLLANIVAIAMLSTPVPFRHFMNDPPNLLPSTFPFVWLPTFLVQAALFGHLVLFRALRSRHLKNA